MIRTWLAVTVAIAAGAQATRAEPIQFNCDFSGSWTAELQVDLEQGSLDVEPFVLPMKITSVSETHITATQETGERPFGGGIAVLDRYTGEFMFQGIAPSNGEILHFSFMGQCNRKQF